VLLRKSLGNEIDVLGAHMRTLATTALSVSEAVP
jgi:hypothetical protein